MQGFRNFLEGKLQVVSPELGTAELNRLQERHHLFSMVLNHNLAATMMSGQNIPTGFRPTNVAEIQKQSAKLEPFRDTVLILAFPKRWESKLGKENIFQLLGEMSKQFQVNNYIWGSFSLWNPRVEEKDNGGFYRNPNFHAHDGLLERWIEKHPIPERILHPVPLDRAPRIMGHSLLDQGRHSFHGYTADKPSGVD